MSDGNRGRLFEIVTAIFLAVIVASVLKLTWDLSASNSKFSQEAEQSAEQYADRTDERIAETCAGMSAAALAKCADEIIKSSHEAQTAQRDLAAQRGMHTWAIAMFWATAASVFVTGIGIFFVWRTLNANTAAVDEAREANRIARSEQRPWISLNIDVTHVFVFENGKASLTGSIIIKNIGKSPTNCVEIFDIYSFKDVQNKQNKVVNSARDAKLIFNLLPNQEANRLLIGEASNDDLIYVTSAASYIFEGNRFITSATWSICSCEYGSGTMTSFSQGVSHGKASILVNEIHELNVVE
jgi:hypothetical protein